MNGLAIRSGRYAACWPCWSPAPTLAPSGPPESGCRLARGSAHDPRRQSRHLRPSTHGAGVLFPFRPVESAQYTSGEFSRTITAHGFVPSMSRKDNCWDNAVVSMTPGQIFTPPSSTPMASTTPRVCTTTLGVSHSSIFFQIQGYNAYIGICGHKKTDSRGRFI